MIAPKLRKRPSKLIIGVSASVVVAGGIAIFAHLLIPPQAAPHTYSIDPTSIALTLTDIGTQFALVHDTTIGPTQRTAYPLPYQQQYDMGRGRDFIVRSALSGPGRAEIEIWQTAHGFTPTDPPTIFGPFVADHSSISMSRIASKATTP